MLRQFIILVLLTLSAPASAQVVSKLAATELAAIDARMTSCLDKNPANADMKQCTFAAHEAADKMLNRIYKAFVDRLKKSSQGDDADAKEILKRLTASERAWIAYRDAECALRGTAMLNGSGEGLIVGQCLYSMTRDRAKSLDEQMSEKE